MNNRENEHGNRNEAKSPNQEQSQPNSIQLLEVAQFRADQANENLANNKGDAGRKNLERIAKQHNDALSSLKRMTRENLTLDQLKEKAYAAREELAEEEAIDESDQKAIARELKKVDDAIRFLDNFSTDTFKLDSFKRWQEKRTGQAKEQKREVQIAEQTKNEQEVKEARLILEILAEGGVGVHTSLPKEYHPDHSNGFTNVIDNRLIPGGPIRFSSTEIREFFGISGSFGNDLSRKYEESHVREFVSFMPAETDVYQEIEVPIQEKRFLGSKTVMKKQMQKVGVRPVLHGESVTNGTKEPLVKLRYLVEAGKNEDTSLWYKDYSGRGGNIISMEVLLPQSVAEKVQQEVKSSPVFIRKVVEELMTNKLGVPEKAWRDGDEKTNGHPIRPPYEKWDAAGESIYFKEPNDGRDFKPERVINIKSKKK